MEEMNIIIYTLIACVIFHFSKTHTPTFKIYYDYVFIMEDKYYTPEIKWSDEILYLIRVNKEEKAIVNNEHDAKLAIDSIAANEMKKLEGEKIKVFRQDSPKGEWITVSKQSLGRLYNGAVSTKIKVDYVPVNGITVLKGRYESEKRFISPSEQEKFLETASESIVLQDNDDSETSEE